MPFRIIPAGDSALVVEFEERIDPQVNDRAIGLARSMQLDRVPGVRDVVPTFRSVAIYFDPLKTNFEALFERLERSAGDPARRHHHDRAPLRIPVCYGDEFGPDLGRVAEFGQMSEPDAIAAHAGPTYRVFMLGFVPGFAYLGIVDSRIAMPRRRTPRVRVPAGSIGIAGVQTGIYPAETPGGWQLIGRTPLKPFDPGRTAPFLMEAGDAVQFYPIDRSQFERWAPSS